MAVVAPNNLKGYWRLDISSLTSEPGITGSVSRRRKTHMQKNRMAITAAIIFGVLAVGLTLMWMLGGGRNVQQDPQANVTPVAVPEKPKVKSWVAARPIPPRTEITRAMLREVDLETDDPKAGVPLNDIVGKLANTRIEPGQSVTPAMLTSSLTRVVPANFEVPAGLRAVAIFVDAEQTAGGLVDKGDRVDVIATHNLSAKERSSDYYDDVVEGAPDFTTGRTIAQDCLVLAVDRSLKEAPKPVEAPAAAPGAAPPPPPPPSAAPNNAPQPTKTRVVLAVAPVVASRLVAAGAKGTLHITIRNPNSREMVPVPSVNEYPSRFVRVPKVKAIQEARRQEQQDREAAADRARQRQIEAMNTIRENSPPPVQPDIPPPSVAQIQPIPIMPAPSGGNNGGGNNGGNNGGSSLPAPPSGTEVTVIRGTEKAKVRVPNG